MSFVGELLWRARCRFNASFSFAKPASDATFEARGASVDVLDAARSARVDPPALCLIVTTHARVEACRGLLETLHTSLVQAGLLQRAFVVVLEDASEAADYRPVLATLERRFSNRFSFYRSSRRLAKPGRWLVYQRAFDAVRALSPDHVLFLEDDVVVGPGFVTSALARWSEIEDPEKTVLYLCSFPDDEEHGRWVRFRRRPALGGRALLTQWFDLHAFLVDARFFECLRYEVFAPEPVRWRGRASRSSGVSEQFTRRLFGRGNVYQVRETLGFHGGIPSLLNEDARRERPLNNHPEWLSRESRPPIETATLEQAGT